MWLTRRQDVFAYESATKQIVEKPQDEVQQHYVSLHCQILVRYLTEAMHQAAHQTPEQQDDELWSDHVVTVSLPAAPEYAPESDEWLDVFYVLPLSSTGLNSDTTLQPGQRPALWRFHKHIIHLGYT